LDVLSRSVLFATALVLGGCVGEVADDDEAVDEASAGIVVDPVLGENPDDGPTRLPAGVPSGETAAGSWHGEDVMAEPQPNPWHDPNQRQHGSR
jgi:hypothetical protein